MPGTVLQIAEIRLLRNAPWVTRSTPTTDPADVKSALRGHHVSSSSSSSSSSYWRPGFFTRPSHLVDLGFRWKVNDRRVFEQYGKRNIQCGDVFRGRIGEFHFERKGSMIFRRAVGMNSYWEPYQFNTNTLLWDFLSKWWLCARNKPSANEIVGFDCHQRPNIDCINNLLCLKTLFPSRGSNWTAMNNKDLSWISALLRSSIT